MADDDNGGSEGMVPKSRLAQETERLRSAQARVGELEGELAGLRKELKGAEGKVSSHDALVARNTELEQQLKALEQTRTEDVELVRRGFSDVELVRFEHARAGKDAGAVLEWVDTLKKGKADDAPENLRRFLADPAADAGGDKEGGDKEGGDKGKAGGKGTTRDANNGDPSGTGKAGESDLTQERTRELYQEALRTGDWTAYKEARGIKPHTDAG